MTCRNLLKYLNVNSFYFHDIAYLANSFKLRILVWISFYHRKVIYSRTRAYQTFLHLVYMFNFSFFWNTYCSHIVNFIDFRLSVVGHKREKPGLVGWSKIEKDTCDQRASALVNEGKREKRSRETGSFLICGQKQR